eukprot:TRINITY_DN68258_c0_g1_i1.p1 TRINITY_DN68258_c0_g1~~TRINITY_DN68258_c0_g1_i1.p1  ORF type:complete len:368 (-),score=84.65 TRINITY_DN68258_c0_g1_i1:257-1285(-)
MATSASAPRRIPRPAPVPRDLPVIGISPLAPPWQPPKRAERNYVEKYEMTMNETFRLADRNGDFVISQEELVGMLQALNPQKFDAEVAAGMLRQIDLDKDGVISIQEFVSWLTALNTMEEGLKVKLGQTKGLMMDKFKTFDKDNDGGLSRKDLLELLKAARPDLVDDRYLDVVLDEVNFDANGELGIDEFLAWVNSFSNGRTVQERLFERVDAILDCFKAVDTDGNGAISKAELSRVLRALNPRDFTEAKADRLISAIDVNGNGVIDYREFVSWLVGTGLTPREVVGAIRTAGQSRGDDNPADSEEGLPPGWEAVMSKSKGRVYYLHGRSGVRQWKKPAAGS